MSSSYKDIGKYIRNTDLTKIVACAKIESVNLPDVEICKGLTGYLKKDDNHYIEELSSKPEYINWTPYVSERPVIYENCSFCNEKIPLQMVCVEYDYWRTIQYAIYKEHCGYVEFKDNRLHEVPFP